MSESGKDIVRLKGGYKAFRSYLMQETEDSTKHFKPIILGGRTGSGKTILLKNIKNAIDLEALKNFFLKMRVNMSEACIFQKNLQSIFLMHR